MKAAGYPSTFGFWFWSKKDLCRVDMEMVGSVSVSQAPNARDASWVANHVGRGESSWRYALGPAAASRCATQLRVRGPALA